MPRKGKQAKRLVPAAMRASPWIERADSAPFTTHPFPIFRKEKSMCSLFLSVTSPSDAKKLHEASIPPIAHKIGGQPPLLSTHEVSLSVYSVCSVVEKKSTIAVFRTCPGFAGSSSPNPEADNASLSTTEYTEHTEREFGNGSRPCHQACSPGLHVVRRTEVTTTQTPLSAAAEVRALGKAGTELRIRRYRRISACQISSEASHSAGMVGFMMRSAGRILGRFISTLAKEGKRFTAARASA